MMKRVTRSSSKPTPARRSVRQRKKRECPTDATAGTVKSSRRGIVQEKNPKQALPKYSRKVKHEESQSSQPIPTVGDDDTDTTDRHRVIVIGAGCAGLACARELRERGFEVVVLEARNRPGGRLKTIPIRLRDYVEAQQPSQTKRSRKRKSFHPLSQHNNIARTISSLHNEDESTPFCPIDTGGAFIHGIDKNPIYEACKKIGISTSRPMKGEDCLLMEYHNSGWPVNAEIDYKVQKRFNYVLDQAFKLSKAIINLANSSREGSPVKNEADIDSRSSVSLPIPRGADSKTSFGRIFEYVASCAHLKGEADLSILNDAGHWNFLRTGGYAKNSIEASLFGWHVMNLEMSCGTTFDKLGLTWNEDECWGFGGEHVLLREGFGSFIECLKEGLDIIYDIEVTGMRLVEEAGEADIESPLPEKVFKSKPIETKQLPNSKRRSSRSNKGKIDRINIGHLSSKQKELGTYDVNEDLVAAYDNLQDKKNHAHFKHRRKYPVQVRTKSPNFSVLEADSVVCTIPLGVLSIPQGKPGHIDFAPPLPQRKMVAINNIGFGNYNKCVLSFSNKFWSSAADFVGVIGSPVAGTDVLFCNVSIVQDGLPLIVFLYGGKNAAEVEKLSDDQVVEECLNVMKRVCGKSKIPPPTDYYVTRWGLDKFARGSFTYCPEGVNGEEELRVMSQPIYKTINGKDDITRPLILFAGESTTPYHPSTIHGAWLSGVREAYRLDFSIYPEENNFLKFQDSYLYQNTFSLRRRFKSKSTSISNKRQVETLRVVQLNSSSRRKVSSKFMGAQRSPRKRKINKTSDDIIRRSRRTKDGNDFTNNELCEAFPESTSSQIKFDGVIKKALENHFTLSEDVALLRGVDTFGRDEGAMKLIRDLMFPVPDTNSVDKERMKNLNVEMLSQRYDELMTEGADHEVGSPNDIEVKWTASKESLGWWLARENPNRHISGAAKRKDPISPFRKSARQRKPRRPTCYDDL